MSMVPLWVIVPPVNGCIKLFILSISPEFVSVSLVRIVIPVALASSSMVRLSFTATGATLAAHPTVTDTVARLPERESSSRARYWNVVLPHQAAFGVNLTCDPVIVTVPLAGTVSHVTERIAPVSASVSLRSTGISMKVLR
jgi:hypothetical protein